MDEIMDRFEYGAKILLMIVAAMIPLWFLPLPVVLEFGREVTFSICIVAAFILWLLSLLTRGQIRYAGSLILWAAGLMAIAFGVSTILSKAPLVSLTFGDPLAEKFSSLLLGLLVMTLASSIFQKGKDVKRMVTILILATGIAGVFLFFQLAWGISPLSYLTSYAQGNTFNAIGTMNGFALFMVAIFVTALALLFSASKSFKAIVRWGFIATLIILMLDLMMIHFFTAWLILLGSLIFFFGLMFMYMRGSKKARQEAGTEAVRKGGLDGRYSILILLIAFSVVMLVVKTPFIGSANLPAEVSPSFIATLSVGKQVLSEGTRQLFFGSGPTTFGLDWARYRDPAINQTQFWSVTFAQGFSWLSTLVGTVGILGTFSFILFLLLCLIIFLRHLLKFSHEEHTPVGISIFIGFIAMIFIAVLYPSSLTFVLMLFLMAGLLMALLAHPAAERMHAEEDKDTVHLGFDGAAMGREGEFERLSVKIEAMPKAGWWDITTRIVRFENSWLVFSSSLLAIFFLALGVAAMYLEVGRLRAALTQQSAVVIFNKGNVDGAIAAFEQAASFEDKNFANYIPLVQARMEKIRGLIQRASAGNNVQQEFQNTVSIAIQNSQTAIQLNSSNPFLWRLQGSLYELLIPFIPGSENFSFSSYRKAIELDPMNPGLDIDLARAGLVAVDRLTLTIQQTQGGNRDQMISVRTQALQQILTVLQKAVELKPDLADAHFLATQAALRLGNVEAAIQSAAKAKLAAPFDIGVAFQLGLLYYQQNDNDKAQIEFERAVAMNNNYSNARYFLGLIYDRKGDKTKAIQQFEQIEALNPDNQEVKHILQNLRSGKAALDKIVPPAQPPEKRNETPVKEGKSR